MICPAPSKWFMFFLRITCILCCGFFILDLAHATTTDTPGFAFVTTVNPELQIGINGGINPTGRQTIFTPAGISFGHVSFIHPETISNGDAYLANNVLNLEAILAVGVIYNGFPSVGLDITKIAGAPAPFKAIFYSLSLDRNVPLNEVVTEPSSIRITTINAPQTVTLRVVFQISALQTGNISDRLRLTALTL